MRYRRKAHCVYGLQYHIVLVTKYRRKIIDPEIADYIKKEIVRLVKNMEGRVSEIEANEDHVHILAELSPKKPLTEQVRVIKTVTARFVRKNFGSKIHSVLWGDSFWSDSYFIASAGGVTIDVLKRYIEKQGNPKKMGRPKKADSSPPES